PTSTAVVSHRWGTPEPVIDAQAAPEELFGESPDTIFSMRLSANVAAGAWRTTLRLAPMRVSRNGLTSLLTATADVPLARSLRDQGEVSACFARGPGPRSDLFAVS